MPPYTRQVPKVEFPLTDASRFRPIDSVEDLEDYPDMPELEANFAAPFDPARSSASPAESSDSNDSDQPVWSYTDRREPFILNDSVQREITRNIFTNMREEIATVVERAAWNDLFQVIARVGRDLQGREVEPITFSLAPLSVREYNSDGSVVELKVPSSTATMIEEGIINCYRDLATRIRPVDSALMSRIFLVDRSYDQRMSHFAQIARSIALSIFDLDQECEWYSAPGIEIPCAITDGHRGYVTREQKIAYVKSGVPFFLYVRPEDVPFILEPFTAIMPHDTSSEFYDDIVDEITGISGREYMVVSVTEPLITRFSELAVDARCKPYHYVCKRGCKCGIIILANLAADIWEVSSGEGALTDDHHRQNLVHALESVNFKDVQGFLQLYNQMMPIGSC